MRTDFREAMLEDDRRSEGRRKLFLATSATRAGSRLAVEILDLSANGLLISTTADLNVDETLVVILSEGAEHTARVVWHSGKMIGCRFDEPLSRAELSACLLMAEPPPAPSLASDENGEARPPETLGQRMRALRMASPYTMETLAELAGVSKPTLWKWETDKVRPRQDALERIAKALGVDEIELLYGKSQWIAGKRHDDYRTAPQEISLLRAVEEARLAIASAAEVAPHQVKIRIDFS